MGGVFAGVETDGWDASHPHERGGGAHRGVEQSHGGSVQVAGGAPRIVVQREIRSLGAGEMVCAKGPTRRAGPQLSSVTSLASTISATTMASASNTESSPSPASLSRSA